MNHIITPTSTFSGIMPQLQAVAAIRYGKDMGCQRFELEGTVLRAIAPVGSYAWDIGAAADSFNAQIQQAIADKAVADAAAQAAAAAELLAHPPVPQSVGPAQLRIAIRRLYGVQKSTIDAIIAGIPDEQNRADAQDLWEYTATIHRQHPLVLGFAATLGLTSDEVDAAFRMAGAEST